MSRAVAGKCNFTAIQMENYATMCCVCVHYNMSIMRYISSCRAFIFGIFLLFASHSIQFAGVQAQIIATNNGMQTKWMMMLFLLMMTSQLMIIKAIVMDLNGSSGICNVGNVQLCHITRWNYWYESANNNKTRLNVDFPWK